MLLCDFLAIDSSRRTSDGYLAVNARVARGDNVQTYLGSEVGRPDLSTVRVYRPPEEVFSKDAMQSFAHRPVTLGHPSGPVTAESWKAVAKGWGDGEVARDGEFIRINMLLADADAIQAVEQGTRELSMGYDCELQWGGGFTPSGETYDAKQVRIRANHIAVVPRARGGHQLRIGDSAPTGGATRKELHMTTDAEVRTMRDSVRTMTVSQAAALPIYDNVRGGYMSGMPDAEYFAILDGAQADGPRPDPDRVPVEASRARMIADAAKAHQPAGAGEPLLHARDGRALAALSDHERAYEEMLHDQQNPWRGTGGNRG